MMNHIFLFRNRICRILVLFICSCCIFAYSGTSGILEGRIIDSASKAVLLNVTVQILGTKNGAVSDDEGYYQINNIFPGRYEVRFNIIGYTSVIVKEVTIFTDRRTRLDVEMTASSIELQTVEITAKQPLIQKDQPLTVFTIGEIKLQALPTTNLQDVLVLQPGTTLEGNVRGGKTNEVVYLIDGLPVQDLISGGLGMNLPKTAISNMTLYTGGFEAEYGNALSGIVNVVTKSGDNEFNEGLRIERDNWLSSSVNQQTDHRSEFELFAKGPLIKDRLFYFTSNAATLSDTRWWSDFEYFYKSIIRQDYSGINKLEYVASTDLRISLQSIYSLSRWKDYEFSWRFNLTGLPERETDAYRLALIFSKVISNNSSYTFSLSRYFNRSHIGPDSPSGQSLEPYQYDFYLRYIIRGKKEWRAETRQQIYTLKSDYTSQLNKFNFFKAGFEVNQYTILSDVIKFEPQLTYFGKPIAGADLLNYSSNYNYYPRSGSAYIQDRIESSHDGAMLNFGMRWDFLDPRATQPIVDYNKFDSVTHKQQILGTKEIHVKQQFSPRLGFAAPLDTASMFFFNIGYYFQFPLFDYLYSGINPAQLRYGSHTVLAGNPDLEPERTIAWEIGFKRILSDVFAGSITYFQKSTTNQIDSKTIVPFDSKFAGDYGFASYVNNSEAKASGIEIVLSRENDKNITGSISYTYMQTEGMSETVNQKINLEQWGFPIPPTTFPLSWDQRHTVKVDGNVKLFYDIQSNFIVQYNSARPYTYFPTRDGFTPIDSVKDFVPNNFRMKNVIIINLKISRMFSISQNSSEQLSIYADIRNAFNTKNIKWIDSNGRIGGELSDPGAYYELRRVRVGFTLNL
ncbi:MAG: TonB-dependent receptor [Bacteroidota bacterium]|nr:TonB-dependent receptor [Bacteroidota bacterium]